jgi:Zn-dependent M28 family amino/carboxypeptidase
VFGMILFTMRSALAQKADRLRGLTEAISNGADSAARRQAIIAHLEAAGIPFRLDEFVDLRMRKGTNIVVTIPGKITTETLLLGAHYDRVAQGQGAIDNGASCAVLLDLIDTFKSKRLSRTLQVIFFDLEEAGLRGSEAYFGATREGSRPLQAINFDIFGYGDAFFATASNPEGPLLTALQKAALEVNIPVRTAMPAQYPSSDHANMIAAGIETVGLALIDASEIDAVIDILVNRNQTVPPPPILRTIHSPRDTLAAARIEDVEKALSVVERTVRLIDAQ